MKRITSWKLTMEVEWEDGRTEEIDFPEYLADYVDGYLTELEEERYKEEKWEKELEIRREMNLN
jgi:hypothetical protein